MARNQSVLTRRAKAYSVISALLALTISLSTTTASTYVPNANTSGTWHNTDRWDNGIIPNAVDAEAIFNEPVSTTQTSGVYFLALDGIETTVGSITVNHAGEEFRTQIQDPGGSLVFQTSSGPATLNENLGTSDILENRTRINVPVTLMSDLIVNQNNNLTRNTSTEFTRQITGDASKTITKEGFGNLQFSFSADVGPTEGFLGNLIINNGGVRLIGTNNTPGVLTTTVFRNAAGITVNDGAQLQFGNSVSTVSLAPGAELKLNGAGKMPPSDVTLAGALRFESTSGFEIVCTFNNPVNLQSAATIHVTAVDATGELTDEVRGVGALEKSGAGLLALDAANTYEGGTTVLSGTLAVNNTTGSGVGTGDVTVSGGTLGGTGFIGTASDASNVTLTGGILEPGGLTATTTFNSPSGLFTSPGTLTTFGDVTFDSASSLNIDMAGASAGSQYDQIVTSGIVSLGDATLNVLLDNFTPSGSESFTLISGASGVSGQFASYDQGAEIDLGGVTYYMNYMGGSGHDVVLSPTPPALADADFDGDGDVDGIDFLIWQRGFGSAGGLADGDANGDGQVDAGDLSIWTSQFGSLAAVVGAVPEPTTVLLALAGLSIAGFTRRRR